MLSGMITANKRCHTTRRRRRIRSFVRWLSDDSGAGVIETLMAMGLALITTAFMMNALLMLYTRSVIQYAADSGARTAALSGGTEQACEDAARAIITDLAHLYRDSNSTVPRCSRDSELTTAQITASLRPVFPALGPSWNFTIRATSVTEPVP